MNVIFRATREFIEHARVDLVRAHPFADERVAFISVRAAQAGGSLVILAESYHPVADEDYIDDDTVGAMMNQDAIRKALNLALLHPVGVFHIHMHDHVGVPEFSRTDVREQRKFVPDFFKVRRDMPHGALVLSKDRLAGSVWLAPLIVTGFDEYHVVGSPSVIDIVRTRDEGVQRR